MARSGALAGIEHLDLSGCHKLTGCGLSVMAAYMPNLNPSLLSYCDQILDGPHRETADGCHNLESIDVFCCRASGNHPMIN